LAAEISAEHFIPLGLDALAVMSDT